MTPAEAFPFHLCLRLGVLHPDHLYTQLTARQLEDWYRFHSQYCLSIGRDDPFWATHLAMYHNVHAQSEKDAEDFMLYTEREEETQEEFVSRIKLLCQQLPTSTSTSGSMPAAS